MVDYENSLPWRFYINLKGVSSLPVQDADQLLNEAIAQHQAGRLQKAQSLYDTVIALQPDNATAWINLGATRRALGHMKEAVLALKYAVKIVPEQAGAWFNLNIGFAA